MDDSLRNLVDLRDRVVQKNRIAFGLRMDAIERGADTSSSNDYTMYMRWRDRFARLEYELDEEIKELTEGIDIIQEMSKVKGVGFMLSAKVVSMIDIEKCSSISVFWRYCGYGVVDGQAERRKKGEKLKYNPRLKSTCRIVATSFLKTNSPYRGIYDKAKEYYTENRKDWSKLHIHNAALRKMVKIWLSHLWTAWRTMEGLPVTEPYIIGKEGHSRIIDRFEYGWEV